jgi:hypothetical protein
VTVPGSDLCRCHQATRRSSWNREGPESLGQRERETERETDRQRQRETGRGAAAGPSSTLAENPARSRTAAGGPRAPYRPGFEAQQEARGLLGAVACDRPHTKPQSRRNCAEVPGLRLLLRPHLAFAVAGVGHRTAVVYDKRHVHQDHMGLCWSWGQCHGSIPPGFPCLRLRLGIYASFS